MAGALLTVGLLERGVDQEMSRPQLEEVRAQVKACIVDLRHIAGSLRPPALDELGLAMALERFAHVDEHGVRPVGISLGALPERLPAEVETATYRAIEEMLDALADAGLVSVSLSATEDAVQIVVRAQAVLAAQAVGAGGQTGQAQVDLVATRARVELIGGSLRMTATPDGGKRILVEIPIASEGD
jgi:signal transduction histidine kinase